MHHAPEILKEKGHKLTPQRLAIWHLLIEGGHYSADDIFKILADTVPGIDKSTVYRTLELLSELTLVRETKLPDNISRFEATDRPGHHHMVCDRCKTIFHFEDKMITLRLEDAAKSKSFSNSRFEVCINGICRNCQPKEGYEN